MQMRTRQHTLDYEWGAQDPTMLLLLRKRPAARALPTVADKAALVRLAGKTVGGDDERRVVPRLASLVDAHAVAAAEARTHRRRRVLQAAAIALLAAAAFVAGVNREALVRASTHARAAAQALAVR